MRWIHAEYALKGVFLGLLAYAASRVSGPAGAGVVGLCLASGLAAGLGVAAVRQLRRGVRPAGRLGPYVLFLLLEHPHQVYGGTIFGLALGVALTRPAGDDDRLLAAFVGAGLLMGLSLIALRLVPGRWARFGLALAVGGGLVAAGLWALNGWPELIAEADRRAFGLCLLIGLPFYYLLTFSGEAEETEADVAAWCGGLAIAVWLIGLTPRLPALALVLPLAVYYAYANRVLPGLRVFKHALRGLSYAGMGRPRDALACLRRAVQLDPTNRLARATLWDIHRRLDPAEMAADAEMAGLVDPHLCLDRVAGLMADPPTPAQAAEAGHLLDLVERREPGLRAPVTYWRAVAALHAKDVDGAAAALERLLEPAGGDTARPGVLFNAWHLALVLHPGLAKRVGASQLALPGRRMEAIDAVERVLAEAPADPAAWGLKRLLYAPLNEAEFLAGPAGRFDPAYAEQLGLALLNEPGRVGRGAEFLTIAARGLPAEAPRLLMQAAEALAASGDVTGAARARSAAKHAGPDGLSEAARHAYFAALKQSAEAEAAAGDLDSAAADMQAYCDYERSGVETRRALADLYERRGDVLAALRANEQALLYTPDDADLKARRDRYYYSVTPDDVARAAEPLRQAVNVEYCLTKARQLVELRDADADLLDWARHLAELGVKLRPRGFRPRLLLARALLRLGERDQALQLLEDIRGEKPEKFADSAEEDAWLAGTRMLGDLYLDELDRPDLAVGCFLDYRTSSKSGADTLYKLARGYERLGETARAASYYRQVAAYEGHPLAIDADAGLRRVSG